MTRRRAQRTVLAAALGSLLFPSFFEQGFSYGQTALDNARSGAVRSRAPGRMVNAGVAQAIAFGGAARAGIPITETSRPKSFRTDALTRSITLIFEQLNQAISLFHNLLLARAGKPPVLPTKSAPIAAW